VIKLTATQAGLLLSYWRGGGAVESTAAAFEQIEEQLNNPNHEADLIDTIVKLLTMRNAKLVSGPAVLENLRKAVLSPKELARANALMNTAQNCIKCNRQLIDGETVTIIEQTMYCVSCYPPSVVYCVGCKNHISVNSISRVITKEIKGCGICKERREAPGAAPVQVEQETDWRARGAADARADALAQAGPAPPAATSSAGEQRWVGASGMPITYNGGTISFSRIADEAPQIVPAPRRTGMTQVRPSPLTSQAAEAFWRQANGLQPTSWDIETPTSIPPAPEGNSEND
jgi:hypothetical protein